MSLPVGHIITDTRDEVAARAEEYMRFIESKHLAAKEAGFDLAENRVNEQLFPFQRDIVRWALRKGRAAIFSDCGCVDASTIIQGPNGAERIDILARRRKPIRVWALTPSGSAVAAYASAPFKKGVASLHRFVLSSGKEITVTGDHRFLTPEGWRYASSLRVGGRLAVSSASTLRCGADHSCRAQLAEFSRASLVNEDAARGYFVHRSSSCGSLQRSDCGAACLHELSPFPPVSSPAPFLSESPSGAPRCARITQGLTGHYSTYRHPCDGRLHAALDTYLQSPPLQVDVLAHSRGELRTDDLGNESSRIHHHPQPDHLSKQGSPLPAYCGDRDGVFRAAALHPTQHFYSRQGGQLSAASANPHWLDHGWFQYQQGLGDDQYASALFFDTVIAINYVYTDVYYDLHVPGYENYLANGIWNHNTGKTPMQLEWAKHVHETTGENVLIFAPLAVSAQTVREGEKFGIKVNACRNWMDVEPGINVTNYERLHHFKPERFGGIVLDESSILKSYDGKTRVAITEFAELIPYRLACTATPAPNDIVEIINHAEFLGIMNENEVKALFFTQDGNTTVKWRLKGHARKDFWRWLASWCVALRSPADLGYSDDGFVLPELSIEQHTVDAEWKPDGYLFPTEALTLNEQRQARRDTIEESVSICAEMVNGSAEPWLVWCDLNDESAALAKAIADAVEVTGSDTEHHKEESMLGFADGKIRVLVSKPSIAGWGMNFQNCANVAFVGLSHSYESMYQAIRRCYRFGQKRPVTVNIITSSANGRVVANVKRKEAHAKVMMDEIVKHMSLTGQGLLGSRREEMDYDAIHEMRLPEWLERNTVENAAQELA